ncbi:hypothetical protein BGZ76_009557 [Entomortierella beljakovae]|nr:hypothetical protein BGZ76_009557 [Entomortierella beljakovae]
MIVFTLCLSLMSIASMVTNFWLTSSTRISSYTKLGPQQEITLMDVPLVTEDLSFTSTSGVIFNSFVAQSGASASGVVKLTPYNNRFFWSPFLNVSTPQTVAVQDVKAFSVSPSCTLLTAPMLNIAYNNSVDYGTDYPLNISTYQFIIPGVRGRLYYWGCEVDTYMAHDGVDGPVGAVVYNIMVRATPEFGPASFILSARNQVSYVYVTNCTVNMEWWDVTGTISSLEHQRLVIDSATKTPAQLGNAFFFQAVYSEGLSGFTKSQQGIYDNSGYNLKSPLWMWMMGRSYGMANETDPLSMGVITHPAVTNAVWMESKLVEILGGTVTVNTGAVVPRKYIGQQVILTSVVHADRVKIIGSVSFLSFILWAPILIYIAKRKPGVYYGDDILILLDNESNDKGGD